MSLEDLRRYDKMLEGLRGDAGQSVDARSISSGLKALAQQKLQGMKAVSGLQNLGVPREQAERLVRLEIRPTKSRKKPAGSEEVIDKYFDDYRDTIPADYERGVIPSFKRGLKSGVSGILAGYGEQVSDKEQPWYEHLAELAGETASDAPAMMVGSSIGAAAGAPIGGIGAIPGAAAGAFAAPTLLKHSVAEYRDYVKGGGDASFGDFLERAGRTAKETGKAAIIGGVTGKMSKLLPILREIPGMSKLLNTKPGRAIGEVALDVAGITGTQAAIEGEMPTVQQIIDNAFIATGARGAHLAARKMKLGKAVEPVVRPAVEKAKEIAKKASKGLRRLVPKEVKDVAAEARKEVGGLRKTPGEKIPFEMLKDHVGARDAKLVEARFKREAMLEKAQKKGKYTKENLEEMMYYRQKTGNPFKEGDTYKELAKRLPKGARKFNEMIGKHLDESLKTWNDNPATKNINPREALEEVYLPGLYEYDPKKFARATNELSNKFKTKNPFSNPKTFMSYNEAFKKAGLKPLHKNIIDLVGANDRIMIKTMANNELLKKVKTHEKENKTDIIVNPSSRKKYQKAKADGYVPFESPFLRRYVAGEKGGKLIHSTSEAPALVHPDFAEAFQGVFNKETFRPGYKIVNALDSLADLIRFKRVALSPYHYEPLMESAVGGKDVKALNLKKWLGEGTKFQQNKEFMMSAADSGLKADPIDPKMFKRGEALIDKAVDYAEGKKAPKIIQKSLRTAKRGMEFLFKEFHPKLKLTTWNDYNNDVITKLAKEGRPPGEAEIKQIKRDNAELVNNMYDGQRWETMKFFNNPKHMRFLRRALSYTDWTVSAGRQFMDAFAPGMKGKQGRKYWAKYGLASVMIQQTLKYLTSGFEQTDKENLSPSGVSWNPKKAMEGLTQGDPSKWYHFPLPDFNVKIGNAIFNPGRDSGGKKLFAHTGKQFLEVPRYYTDPVSALFSKANPLVQIIGEQVMGGTPYEGETRPARAVYKRGKLVPWEGTERGSLEQYISRGKEIAKDVTPFSLRGVHEHGVLPTLATGGMLSISQGISLTKAEPMMRKALKSKDIKMANRIRRALKDNAYSDKSIKSMITRARKS